MRWLLQRSGVTALNDLYRKKGWVFDLDGTLTLPVHDFEYIRQQLGIAPGADILHHIEQLPEPLQRAKLVQLDQLEQHFASQAAPSPGVHQCLETLYQHNVRLGILTRNSREVAISSLKAIGVNELFSVEDILGRDEAAAKPSAEGINKLMKRWQLRPVETVMVGDYLFDLQAGRNAGVTTIHVDQRERSWPEETDLRLATLAELTPLLQK